jgi:hypothetical protein
MDVWEVGACICFFLAIIALIVSLEGEDIWALFMVTIFALMGIACVILCVESKSEKIKQSINEAANIYINGEPVSDSFNLDGITLDRYHIRIDDDNVYLETK